MHAVCCDVVLIAHFKVRRVSDSRSLALSRTHAHLHELYNLQHAAALPPSLPPAASLGMDGGLGGGESETEREREREGSVGLGLVSVVRLFGRGRSILRSAEFFFFSFLHSPLPPSVVSLASNHERHLRMRCRRRRRSFCIYSSLFLPPLSLSLSLSLSTAPSSHGFLQSLRSPSLPLSSVPTQSMTKSTAHEISPTHLRMPLSLLSVP